MKKISPIDKDKDRLLYCGTNGIDRMIRYMTSDGFDHLIKAWLIVSIPSLLIILWASSAGYLGLGSLSFFKAIVLSVWIAIAIFGVFGDLIKVWEKTKKYWGTHELARTKKMVRFLTKWTGKSIWAIIIVGSPIIWVWFLSARHSGEYHAFPKPAGIIFSFSLLIALFGCIADFWLVFGELITQTWKNRENNLIGMTRRTGIRGVGLLMYIMSKCK